MRIFEHPNTSNGWKCPICKTDADQPVTLVGIPGTENGGIMQAEQVHAECYKVVLKMNATDDRVSGANLVNPVVEGGAE
jgi:hypothetical protein